MFRRRLGHFLADETTSSEHNLVESLFEHSSGDISHSPERVDDILIEVTSDEALDGSCRIGGVVIRLFVRSFRSFLFWLVV